MITPKDIKPDGKVDLWDMVAEGGPVKVSLFTVDAKHALAVEPERYRLKLPPKASPGPAQIEAEERAKAEFEGDAPDPIFGDQR